MIQYNKIYKSKNEEKCILDALQKRQISGDGCYSKMIAELLQKRFGLNSTLMTTSATHALELSMLVVDLKPGDEVIMPSYTFSSTANAVLLRGAKPVFAEIEEDTLNINPDAIQSLITPNTKAIVPVHYAGISCRMDEIMNLADEYKLFVIEDAAQGVNARYKNRYLGSIGHMGCYSFHGTKNFTSGEGGALLVNIDNEQIVERAECIRQKGTDRSKFLRGEVSSYSWVDLGSSYSPSDILMAMLYGQLQDMDYITTKRKSVHDFYSKILKKYVDKGLIKMTEVPKDCESNYHIFYILFMKQETRDYVKQRLQENGISAVTHFMPLHSSAMGKKLGYKPGDLPITESASQGILRLPVYPDLRTQELDYIGSKLTKILEEI